MDIENVGSVLGSTHFSLEKCRWANWIFEVFAVAML